ncbi:Biopolymer transport protein ExbB [Sedimentisphaera cyanobacteriorum]|uniref:Biopolymer transport protein ExbB n=1 Tax=Sedimentisphaera cyanobacteriorum TaxID=1940790 RepID=A0A1Q2HQV4_9BACT|nr:MotA/TolQ/ExbB proton channel family protein [Sedimentisphaera cyanobacteriorum]AQQ09711.1 Biopolymer transport protein ExbB [Sedimentisphaera cyanobacteriorum]
MKLINKIIVLAVFAACSAGFAQQTEKSFSKAAVAVDKKLEESLKELNQLREEVAEKKVPLSKKVSELESELMQARRDYQQTTRMLDSRTLDLNNLRSEIKSRKEEAAYLSNLLSEYARNFESRLHIAEMQKYKDTLESAKLAPENSNLTKKEVYKAQASLIETSLERIEELMGGSHFNGKAVGQSGLVKPGTFVMTGPAAIFRSGDGEVVGTVTQQLGSLEPSVKSFGNPADAQAASQVITTKQGYLPLDTTLGNAHVIEETKQTVWEHIQKGGPVMVPILGMAGLALLVAIWKWVFLSLVRKPSRKKFDELLDAVYKQDKELARVKAAQFKGPFGRMFNEAVEHLKEPAELIEEVMYETVLSSRLKLQRFLPFISICAASAPLLGLLGTVTGIINTFKLITVFGSGDVKTLSGGISEALITTEFGLIVAIPSLLLHALLSRKAKGIIDDMEKNAVALVNQVSRSRYAGVSEKQALQAAGNEQ